MNQLLIFLFCITTCLNSLAQKNNNPKYYFLNGTLDYVDKFDINGYILCVEKNNENKYEYAYYLSSTLKIYTLETYKDEKADSADGLFAYYNYSGNIDSAGYVSNFKRVGFWRFYDSNGQKADSVLYTKKYENGILISESNKPSQKDTTNFIEAKFESNWSKFLEKQLTYPENALKNKSQGKVNYAFTINTEGKIIELYLLKSQNLYLDLEAKRIIKKSSGLWTPATKDGKLTNSYHSQQIYFIIP